MRVGRDAREDDRLSSATSLVGHEDRRRNQAGPRQRSVVDGVAADADHRRPSRLMPLEAHAQAERLSGRRERPRGAFGQHARPPRARAARRRRTIVRAGAGGRACRRRPRRPGRGSWRRSVLSSGAHADTRGAAASAQHARGNRHARRRRGSPPRARRRPRRRRPATRMVDDAVRRKRRFDGLERVEER